MTYSKRGMKTISKKIGFETQNIKNLCLYTRSGVGTHIGMVLEHGKENSVIIGVTHARTLSNNIHTIDCDFSSLSINNSLVDNFNKTFKKSESRAILTIVNNKTMEYKNQKILNYLQYKTGLINFKEQEYLKEKILLTNKITYLSNTYNSKDTHILYQTKTKTEAISITDNKRIINLIGYEIYEKHFKSLSDLPDILGEQRLSISDILKKKIDTEGIGAIVTLINKIT